MSLRSWCWDLLLPLSIFILFPPFHLWSSSTFDFCPIKIVLCNFFVWISGEMNKALKCFCVNKSHVLPIFWFMSKTPQFHTHPCTLYLISEVFSLPTLQGMHVFPSHVCTVSCAMMLHVTSALLELQDAYVIAALPQNTALLYLRFPGGAVSCQGSSWKKEELREIWLTFNWIAYGAEENKEAVLTFTKLNG